MGKDIAKKVLKMYNEDGNYLAKNGTNVGIAIALIIVFSTLTGYINVKSNLKMLQKDFPKIRCDPVYAAFAGEIAAPEGVSKLKFSADNFEQCTKNVLKGVAAKAFSPIEMLMSVFNNTFGGLNSSMGAMMGFFDGFRENIARIPTMLYGIILSVLVPLRRGMRALESLFGRLHAIGQTIIYMMVGTSNLLISVLNTILDFFIGILVSVVVVIVGFLLASLVLPMVFQPLAAATILAATALMGFTLAVIIIIAETFKSHADGSKIPTIPEPPTCFHPNTEVELNQGVKVPISELELGAELLGGGKVKGKMKIANREEMYVFGDTKTIVSGSHLVYSKSSGKFMSVKTAFKDGWKHLERYPYPCPEVYCLITSNHIIPINGLIFHDWEDSNGSTSKSW